MRDAGFRDGRECLERLRLHAFFGRDDEDGDVGRLRAARPQSSERLVSWRVEERYRTRCALVWVFRLVGRNVLGNTARLVRDDIRLADVIEKRRLPVIYVANDGNDGRAWSGGHTGWSSSQKRSRRNEIQWFDLAHHESRPVRKKTCLSRCRSIASRVPARSARTAIRRLRTKSGERRRAFLKKRAR